MDALKSVVVFYELYHEDIDALIEDGVDPMEIEEISSFLRRKVSLLRAYETYIL